MSDTTSEDGTTQRRGRYSLISRQQKEIFIQQYEDGKTIADAASIANLNVNTAKTVLYKYKRADDEIITKKRGGKRIEKVTENILNFVENAVEQNPCITLKTIRAKLLESENVNLSIQTICNCLSKLKITLELRRIYALNFTENSPEDRNKIFFIDESGFNLHLRRTYARSRVGTSANVIVPAVRGRNITLIAAISDSGVVHHNILTSSNCNSAKYCIFLRELLEKIHAQSLRDVWLIMDNAAIHKTSQVQEIADLNSAKIIFLSPYSPMLNPIEKVFSKLITISILIVLEITFVTPIVPRCNQLLTFIDTQFINNANNYESWFGNIRLPVNTGIKTPLITISLIFDHPVDSILSNYGSVLKLNSTLFRLVKRNSITNERNLSFEFFVRYNGTYPKLSKILINNEAQCDDTQQLLNLSKRSMNSSSRKPKYVPDCSNAKYVHIIDTEDDKTRLMVTINFYEFRLRNENIVNVAFDKRVIILGISNQTTCQTVDGHHFQITLPTQYEQNPMQLKFYAKYNEFEVLPKITEVNMNGLLLCWTPTLNPLKLDRQPRAKNLVACPSSDVIKNYKSDKRSNLVYAEIHINRGEIDKSNSLVINVTFDRKVYNLRTIGYPIGAFDGKSFAITPNCTYSQEPLVLHISARFKENEPSPKIAEVRVNEKMLCGCENVKDKKESRRISEYINNNNKVPSKSLASTLEPSSFLDWLVVPSLKQSSLVKHTTGLNRKCKFYAGLMVAHNKNGDTAERNQFPWHAAIYYGTIDDYVYTCGGSLISIKMILTAAHCVMHKQGAKPLPIENFIVYLGLHSLRAEMGGEQYRRISKIIVHPEYNVGDTYYSDIAIMQFDNIVDVTQTVQPICMWDSQNSNDISQLYNRFGIIPGWGLNHGEMSENLTYTTMMVMPKSHCIKKKPEFYTKLLTGKSYCVSGYEKKSSVCYGDSGSGMVIPYDSSLRLRGIVSVSIKEKSSSTCSTDIYPVLTDVAKFLPWIEKHLI